MGMIGTLFLGIWMLLIMTDIWSIKKRIDKLEYLSEKEQTDAKEKLE